MKSICILQRMAWVFLVIILVQVAHAQEISGFNSPESVVSDGKFLYVSNVGKELKPDVKDGDGTITKLSFSGEIIKKDFITGLNAPKGMAVINNTLYVTDIDRVLGFNLVNGNQTYELTMAETGTKFLNDLTIKDNNTLFVSSTDLGKVFEVHLTNVPMYHLIEVETIIIGANGLVYDPQAKRLYINGFGKEDGSQGEVGLIEWKNNKPTYRKISTQTGLYDGLALMSDGQLLVSDWVDYKPVGVLRKIDPKTGKVSIINAIRKLAGPADFYYDAQQAILYQPEMMAGKVLIQKDIK